jgi:small-conductance mechanosensitive channel
VVGARLATIVMLGTLDRLLRPAEAMAAASGELPVPPRRVSRYRRPLDAIAVTIIVAVAGVTLLQLWGLSAFDWFMHGAIGGRLVQALATIGIAVLAAVVVWELSRTFLDAQLARMDGRGPHTARLMTLLPLLRTALLTTILAVIGLTALSEIGVNVAPLLAGAGIAGIAIGFGSQHLVRDVITGMFVLLENAIQIGDNVTVAGLAGTIEQLSVRTMRLRAGDGAVHIIPFSAVTTITNASRGLGNAAVLVTVAYEVDTDRVLDVLREIGADLRADPDFAPRIVADLQIFGVDQVRPWGVTITGQIACTDTGRWAVQREFNRRLKKRFDELDIRLGGALEPAARS